MKIKSKLDKKIKRTMTIYSNKRNHKLNASKFYNNLNINEIKKREIQ